MDDGPTTLVGAARERAAGVVIAYSAICPPAGCEVDGWIIDHRMPLSQFPL
jgi:hypothetical protein